MSEFLLLRDYRQQYNNCHNCWLLWLCFMLRSVGDSRAGETKADGHIVLMVLPRKLVTLAVIYNKGTTLRREKTN